MKNLLEDDLEEEEVICNYCNGSGEGQHDGSICQVCKGFGTLYIHSDLISDLYKEEEE